MRVLRCDLVLHEPVFFASREIGDLFETAPAIGNYALCYALRLVQGKYRVPNRPTYREDLAWLNEAGIYITPAELIDQPRCAASRCAYSSKGKALLFPR